MKRVLLAATTALLVAAPAAPAAEVAFTMPGKSFSPARALAVPGDTLVWRNTDVFNDHDIRAGDGSFDSGRLGRYQGFSLPATRPGTLTFLCTLHLGMSGAVDIVPAILDAPKGEVVGGAPATLSGRAPVGVVRVERETPAGWVEAAMAHTSGDGAFAVTVRPEESASYRAVSAAGAGPSVLLRAVAKLDVGLRRTSAGVTATVDPAPKGMTAALELYSRERFAWRTAGRRPVPAGGKVRFAIRPGLRRTARVVVRRADGTELARSGSLQLWRRGARPGRPAPDRPAPDGDAGGNHGNHGHGGGHGPGERAHAAADSFTTDLPETFARQIERAKRRTRVAILLPDTIRTELERVYPSGGADARGYSFALGAVRGCGGATACFVASFSADRGEEPFGRRVTLRGGRRGWFTASSCGASCAAPQIQWMRGSVRYTIQASIGTQRTERARLVALANSALAAGPR